MKALAKDPDVESRRAVTPRSADEINLAEYVATCWRYRWVIVPSVLLAALLSYIVNRQITPTYEVTVRLLATESRVVDDATSRALSVARFRELLESPSLVATVMSEFKLSEPPHQLTPRRFLAANLSVSEIPDTGILRASIRLTDPDLLVKLANGYAQKAVDKAEFLNQDETKYAREGIKRQADQAKTRLAEAERDLEAFRQKTQIELLRKDVEALLDNRPDVMALQVDIETERAQLRQAEIELAGQEPVRGVRRSLDSLPDRPVPPKPVEPKPSGLEEPRPEKSPVWNPPQKPRAGTPEEKRAAVAAAPAVTPPEPRREPAAPAPLSGALPIRGELLDPYANPVYEVLARDVAQSRARLAGLERRRKQLVSELNFGAPTSAKLNALYRAEAELAQLTGEYDVARAAYMNAATKYEESRLQITVRSPRLQILDLALPPERPVAPRIPRNVAAAAMLALTMSVVAVLMIDSARQRRS